MQYYSIKSNVIMKTDKIMNSIRIFASFLLVFTASNAFPENVNKRDDET